VHVERADEPNPPAKRVRPLPLRVSERRQIERENSVRTPEQRTDSVPHEARDDEAAEEDDRRPCVPPRPIRDELPVDVHERATIEGGRRLDLTARRRVVRNGGKRQSNDQFEQDEPDAFRPAL